MRLQESAFFSQGIRQITESGQSHFPQIANILLRDRATALPVYGMPRREKPAPGPLGEIEAEFGRSRSPHQMGNILSQVSPTTLYEFGMPSLERWLRNPSWDIPTRSIRSHSRRTASTLSLVRMITRFASGTPER